MWLVSIFWFFQLMFTRNRVTWCMKANTYTSLRLTISPCARIAPNCASRGDLTATPSVSDTFWRTRLPPSSNVNMWPSTTANAAPTPSPSLRTVGELWFPLCKVGSGWDVVFKLLPGFRMREELAWVNCIPGCSFVDFVVEPVNFILFFCGSQEGRNLIPRKFRGWVHRFSQIHCKLWIKSATQYQPF